MNRIYWFIEKIQLKGIIRSRIGPIHEQIIQTDFVKQIYYLKRSKWKEWFVHKSDKYINNLLRPILWNRSVDSLKRSSSKEWIVHELDQACMNESKIEELGAKPLQDLINQVTLDTWINPVTLFNKIKLKRSVVNISASMKTCLFSYSGI